MPIFQGKIDKKLFAATLEHDEGGRENSPGWARA